MPTKNRYVALLLSAMVVVGVSPALVAADTGHVEMTDGSRVSGDVMAVYVGERVVVRMADGTPTSVPWDRVARVRDGERVYERDGSVRTEAAPPQPSVPAQVTLAPAPIVATTAVNPAAVATVAASGDAISRADAVRMVVQIARLPTRGGSAGLIAVGSMFLVNGLGLLMGNVTWSCDEYDGYYGDDDDGPCGARVGLTVGGLASGSIGVLMLASGVRRLRRRKREIQQLIEQNGMLADTTPRLELGLDVRADAREGRFVPRLTLAF